MNVVILNGRLTRDPELKYGQSGNAYSRFSIAVDRPFSSGENKTADFINCVAFGKTAEFVGEYFRKGRKILLKGSLQMSQYESEGKKLTTYNVIVDNVEFGESKGTSEGSYSNNSYSAPAGNKNNTNNHIEEPSFEEHSGADVDDEFPF
ncbi:single-stranded DNA-binding protein [Fusobacterium massiliense]|jgi:single-stranded DNA-binding protein|uniref:single-stranded DNA-binding protein n=1 Tax=Fusobacterium massiliense TaxID=1852365 RepID=UPI00093A6AAB|nr:single-stranded DNA-binding protein [Fusobacterium massiliense]